MKAKNAVRDRESKKIRVKWRAYIFMLVLASILGFLASTELFAYFFNFQELLGKSYHGIYAPWKIISWTSGPWSQHPSVVQYGMISKWTGFCVGVLSFILMVVIKRIVDSRNKADDTLHGSARWATEKDIERAGLFSNEGVFVGAYRCKDNRIRYLKHNGAEHILTVAPTRSGKGVGLIVPTLLTWTKSAFIADLKGELWELTSGWRKKYAKNIVIKFEPSNPVDCGAWNPVEEIRIGTENEVGDVQNLATLLVDPDGKGLNDHWQKTSQSLLVGLILHSLYMVKLKKADPETYSDYPHDIASLSVVDALMSDPNRDLSELWMEMTQTNHLGVKPHPVIAASGSDMMNRPPEEAGSVLSTAKSYLSLYRDPIVARNTSRCDWKVHDLMNLESPVSLFLVTQPSDKDRLRPLIRIVINTILRQVASKMEFEVVTDTTLTTKEKILKKLGRKIPEKTRKQTKKTYKHELLGVIDEFPSLGKLPIIEESIAFLAGYGVKLFLIIQDLAQIRSSERGYGKDESITSNCHIQNAYAPLKLDTAEYLSKLTGQSTVIKEQLTISGKRGGLMLGQVSRALQETQRPLLTPDECMRMPSAVKDGNKIIAPGEMLISVAGVPAIYGVQPLFFLDPVLNARAAVPAAKTSDKIVVA